ncbi:hypothetical protein LS72_004325 [Helicobacter apodemus]|uniref:Periplasmic protein n=1 Tax=Helicobacter apodemus TaxID=135569 RepID=A0A099UF13_9HELI|nr:hypothetical protein [Helicobacter apodemus]AWI34048.1 hypothetical protein CDV25_04115 [Helicobacter apodemus]TLE16137.1 hypothetical protein LS72_004325 [Helicobacter apodemus]
MKKCCPGFSIAFIIVFAVGAFLYYQYSFTSVSKIYFNQDSFYEEEDGEVNLFEPMSEKYQLCFYSSYMPKWEEFLKSKIKQNESILAIDMYQLGQNNSKEIIDLKVSSGVMLKLIHEFDIRMLPQCFLIKQNQENLMLYQRVKNKGIYKLLNFKSM